MHETNEQENEVSGKEIERKRSKIINLKSSSIQPISTISFPITNYLFQQTNINYDRMALLTFYRVTVLLSLLHSSISVAQFLFTYQFFRVLCDKVFYFFLLPKIFRFVLVIFAAHMKPLFFCRNNHVEAKPSIKEVDVYKVNHIIQINQT